MIEKLTPDQILGLDGLPTTIMPDSAKLMRKINELVDAVNKLDALLDLTNTAIQAVKNETPDDPYAEQRKWIGCLCRFWNFDDDKGDFSILTEVDNKYRTIPFITYEGHSYANCEPVKPTDSIIYEGE